jgi:hypothetical protein
MRSLQKLRAAADSGGPPRKPTYSSSTTWPTHSAEDDRLTAREFAVAPDRSQKS